MLDFEQKIQHCYHNQFSATNGLQRNNLSWFLTTLTSTKTKHLPGILNCHHFDPVCFVGNIMVPILSCAEITQATWIMCSHFATVSDQGALQLRKTRQTDET